MAAPALKVGNIYSVRITGKGKRAGQSRLIRIVKAGKNPIATVQGEKRKVALLGEDFMTGDLNFRVNETGAVHFNATGKLVSYSTSPA